jgi:hypothetical protein
LSLLLDKNSKFIIPKNEDATFILGLKRKFVIVIETKRADTSKFSRMNEEFSLY